jgi:hypothetical protein
MDKRLIGLLAGIAVVAGAVALQLPELRRYMKMKQM